MEVEMKSKEAQKQAEKRHVEDIRIARLKMKLKI